MIGTTCSSQEEARMMSSLGVGGRYTVVQGSVDICYSSESQKWNSSLQISVII